MGAFSLGAAGPNVQDFANARGAAYTIYHIIDLVRNGYSHYLSQYLTEILKFSQTLQLLSHGAYADTQHNECLYRPFNQNGIN